MSKLFSKAIPSILVVKLFFRFFFKGQIYIYFFEQAIHTISIIFINLLANCFSIVKKNISGKKRKERNFGEKKVC